MGRYSEGPPCRSLD